MNVFWLRNDAPQAKTSAPQCSLKFKMEWRLADNVY